MRVIEVITDQGHVDTIRSLADQHEIVDIWVGTNDEDGRCSTRMLVTPKNQQAIIDGLQSLNFSNFQRLMPVLKQVAQAVGRYI